MQDLDKELSRIYDFDIDKIYPLKNYYVIETSEGKRILKSVKLFTRTHNVCAWSKRTPV